MSVVLLGPVKAVSYLLSHGLSAAFLADCFSRGVAWRVSIPIVTIAKAGCQMTSLLLASLTMGEDLLALSVSNIGMLLDKAGLLLGMSSSSAATTTFLYTIFALSFVLSCALLTSVL